MHARLLHRSHIVNLNLSCLVYIHYIIFFLFCQICSFFPVLHLRLCAFCTIYFYRYTALIFFLGLKIYAFFNVFSYNALGSIGYTDHFFNAIWYAVGLTANMPRNVFKLFAQLRMRSAIMKNLFWKGFLHTPLPKSADRRIQS